MADKRKIWAALVTATLLLSPYIYMYDQVMLIVAIIWALQQGYSERTIVRVYMLSLLAFAIMLTDAPVLNLIPLAPLAMLYLLFRSTGVSWPAVRLKAVPAAGIEPAAP